MILTMFSFVAIFLITAIVCAVRFRLIQHRTTRRHDGREIPYWLDAMIDFFAFPKLIWETTSMLAIIIFSIRMYLTNNPELIFVGIFGVSIIWWIAYKCTATVTSKIFSKKILEQYGERTIPEC